MALFSKEDKKAKENEKLRLLAERYGLNELDGEELKQAQEIIKSISANRFFEAGMALSFAKGEEQAKVSYLRTLYEQNWLIINQLNKLNKNIEKLSNK